MKTSNNKILITGGGSGIGLGLTERFLKENNTVIICGRGENKLKEIEKKHPSVITRKCDLSLAKQLEQGRTELSAGFSEAIIKAGPDDLQKTFDRMNNPDT